LKKINKHKEISSVVIIYAVFGCLWIFLSDTILNWFVKDPDIITKFSIFKGSLFIFTTSVLLYFLVARLSTKITLSTTALQESEELLSFLVRNSADILVIVNSDRRQSYVSSGAKRIFGFLTSELEGKPLDTLIHPDDLQAIEGVWEEAIRHPEKTVTVQYRHIHKDKDWIFVEAIAQSFFDDPAINGLIASVRDITEHKLAEQKLEASKAYLHKILNNIGDPVFVKDDQHRMTIVNDAFCTIFSMHREDVIGKTLVEHVPPDEQDHFLKIDRQVLADGKENNCEETLTPNDSKTLTILTKKTRYVAENGDKFLVGVIRDITERKRAEEELKKSNERYSRLTTNIPGLVFQFMLHTDGSYSMPFISEDVQLVFGVSSEEVKRDINSLLQFFHPDDFDAFKRSVIESAESLSLYNHECRTLMDGEVGWINIRSIPERKANGDILWEGVFFDMTDRKLAEKELENHREDLEKMVRERTTDLQRMVNAMAGREVRMVELKQVIKQLREQLKKTS
jgi:PAS domain S-box-containing protein